MHTAHTRARSLIHAKWQKFAFNKDQLHVSWLCGKDVVQQLLHTVTCSHWIAFVYTKSLENFALKTFSKVFVVLLLSFVPMPCLYKRCSTERFAYIVWTYFNVIFIIIFIRVHTGKFLLSLRHRVKYVWSWFCFWSPQNIVAVVICIYFHSSNNKLAYTFIPPMCRMHTERWTHST